MESHHPSDPVAVKMDVCRPLNLVGLVTVPNEPNPMKQKLCREFESMSQGTIGCTPNSVPMVLIGLI